MNRRTKKRPRLNYANIAITLFAITILVLLFTVVISKIMGNSDSTNSLPSSTGGTSRTQSGESAAVSNSQSYESEAQSIPSDESQPESSYSYKIDIEPYLPYIEPDRSGNKNEYWLIIANKDIALSETFVPPDLVNSPNAKPGTANPMLNATASKALEAMLKEAAANGFNKITMSSGYRSYSTQKWWFNYYKDKYRANFNTEAELEEYVNTFSHRPGHSEHQTGLTADIYDTAENTMFNDTPAALWLAENAHKFGYILRYPKGKEHITGIEHESWHFRYVGRSVATEIYKKGWTLEEYLQATRQIVIE